MTAAAQPCRCRCHAYGAGTHVTCDVDTGSSGVPGKPSCSPCTPPARALIDVTWEAGVDAAGLLLDLDFVLEHWDDLAATRNPGTARPWRQPLLDPERQAELAARDREERTTRDPDAPGFTSAPLHLDVLDVAVESWLIVFALVEQIGKRALQLVPGKDRDERRLSTNTTLPRQQLRRLDEFPAMAAFVQAWLPHAVTEWAVDPSSAARGLRKVCREIQRLLSLIRGGQLLAAAVCPWCRGVTPKHPAGGATTLRVEEIVPARPARNGLPASDPLFAVVCWNTECDPPSASCGTRYRGRPAWPTHEWDWLAPQLLTADPLDRPAPAALPVPLVFVTVDGERVEVKPIEHSGRTGHR